MIPKKLRPMTAMEVVAMRANDPVYQERVRKRDAAIADRESRLRIAEEPLLAALRTVGWVVQSVWDLVSRRNDYATAVPTLLEHLTGQYPPEVREGIARALGIPEVARDARAWALLTQAYRDEADLRVKDGLAAAVGAASRGAAGALDDVIELASDPANGPSRVLLIPAIGKSRAAAAEVALGRLAWDPELAEQAAVETAARARRSRRSGRKVHRMRRQS